MERTLLPLPEDLCVENYAKAPIHCGPFVAELALFAAGKIARMRNMPMQVKSKILGGMLPHDMKVSLEEHFSKVEISQPLGSSENHLQAIRNVLDSGRPATLFVGHAAGHWIAVWGYEGKNFFVFDSRKNAIRDEHGLTHLSANNLINLWGKIPIVLKPLPWLSCWFPRLELIPFTMVTAW